MLVNRGAFVTKTMEGRIIEGFIGTMLIILTAPFMIISILGNLCGGVLDASLDIERSICDNLQERGL